MDTFLPVLLFAGLWALFAGALASVVRELMRRDLQRISRTWAAGLPALDLDLSRNLDHPLGRQVESIDDFGRVSIKKRE